MIISHSHKFIFIKSFKTAGTSLESILSNVCSGDDIVTPLNDFKHNRTETGEFIHKAMNYEEFSKLGLKNLQHADAKVIKENVSREVWEGYFKFSIARNPWDRAVSFFFWEMRQDPRIKPEKKFYHHLGIPFDEIGQLRELFANFLNSGDWPSNDPFYVMNGKLCVDYIIRYENLQNDFSEVCRRIGIPEMPLPRLKGGIRSNKYHYTDYYNDETKELVAQRHANDIRLFGYTFEKPAL